MSATATHDSKRGEDMRARLHVLSEVPDEWARRVRALAGNEPAASIAKSTATRCPTRTKSTCSIKRSSARGRSSPMSTAERDEYRDRIVQYMEKALREAKIHTSWMNPSEAYEAAVFEISSATCSSDEGRGIREPI